MGPTARTRVFTILAAGCVASVSTAARADDASGPKSVFDSVLEKLQIKATPADPAPDFVRRTRPDPSGLDYEQRPLPHKVSPLPTKTPAEVQAAKDALDQARLQQLAPAKPPTEILKHKAPRASASAAKPPN